MHAMTIIDPSNMEWVKSLRLYRLPIYAQCIRETEEKLWMEKHLSRYSSTVIKFIAAYMVYGSVGVAARIAETKPQKVGHHLMNEHVIKIMEKHQPTITERLRNLLSLEDEKYSGR